MKKKLNVLLFVLLISSLIGSNVSAAYSQVYVGFLDARDRDSVPIHSGSVLGTANHLENLVTGQGYVRLSVRQHLVGGIHPEVE